LPADTISNKSNKGKLEVIDVNNSKKKNRRDDWGKEEEGKKSLQIVKKDLQELEKLGNVATETNRRKGGVSWVRWKIGQMCILRSCLKGKGW